VEESTPKAETAAVAGPQMPTATRAVEPRVEDFMRMMPSASLIAFVWTWGLQSVIAYFLLARMHVEHSRRVLKSDEQTLQNTRDLVRTRDAVIFGLAKLAESRDPDTGYHLERISLYSTRLASTLSRIPRYGSVVTPAFVRLIGISSALHDIGKVGIEDAVLLKPGEFNSSERFCMQSHAKVASDCIFEIERRLGTSNFLEMAREIAHWHHERWDGTGYPDGLFGEQIPLAARIVAIADVYDALSVRRVYKEALPHDECVAIIRQEAGRQCDPDLVRVFLQIEPQFREIARQFAGNSASEGGSSLHEQCRQHLTPEQEMTLLAALSECSPPLQFKQVTPDGV
jgi:response regulator RpfG family c-di-GMP phosphodiesterase